MVSAPRLYAHLLDSFGYSAGRLWVTDDQAHVRVWHRYLTGDKELRRLGPLPDAIVDRDGAVKLSLPTRGASSSTRPPRSAPSTEARRVLPPSITGNEKIVNDAFVQAIRRAGVRLCLHGHVHEDRADLLGYPHPTSRLHVIGAGPFGAPARERPESIPRLYNLLEIDADRRRVRVHTRSLQRADGAWEPWYAWPGETAGERRPFYEVDLDSSGLSSRM